MFVATQLKQTILQWIAQLENGRYKRYSEALRASFDKIEVIEVSDVTDDIR